MVLVISVIALKSTPLTGGFQNFNVSEQMLPVLSLCMNLPSGSMTCTDVYKVLVRPAECPVSMSLFRLVIGSVGQL